MGAARRTFALFVGNLLAVALLLGCGQSAPDPESNAVRQAIGIPVLADVHSGELETTMSVEVAGRGRIDMRILGAFLEANGKRLPQADFAAEANGSMDGEVVDVFTALIATRDRAVLTYDGDTFETSRPMFEALESSLEQSLGTGSAGDPAVCLEAVGRVDPGRIVSKVTSSTSTTMYDGTRVSVTEADLRGPTLADALRQLLDDSGCGAQLQATGSLRKVLEGVEGGLRRKADEVHGRLAVDKNGNLGELSLHLVLGASGSEKTTIDFLTRLTHVNEIADLPPCYGERKLAALFAKLGFNPLERLEHDAAEGLIGLIQGIQEGRKRSSTV